MAEAKDDIADLHFVIFRQPAAALNSLAVDVRAIAAAEVFDEIVRTRTDHAAVPRSDRGQGDHDIATGPAAHQGLLSDDLMQFNGAVLRDGFQHGTESYVAPSVRHAVFGEAPCLDGPVQLLCLMGRQLEREDNAPS